MNTFSVSAEEPAEVVLSKRSHREVLQACVVTKKTIGECSFCLRQLLFEYSKKDLYTVLHTTDKEALVDKSDHSSTVTYKQVHEFTLEQLQRLIYTSRDMETRYRQFLMLSISTCNSSTNSSALTSLQNTNDNNNNINNSHRNKRRKTTKRTTKRPSIKQAQITLNGIVAKSHSGKTISQFIEVVNVYIPHDCLLNFKRDINGDVIDFTEEQIFEYLQDVVDTYGEVFQDQNDFEMLKKIFCRKRKILIRTKGGNAAHQYTEVNKLCDLMTYLRQSKCVTHSTGEEHGREYVIAHLNIAFGPCKCSTTEEKTCDFKAKYEPEEVIKVKKPNGKDARLNKNTGTISASSMFNRAKKCLELMNNTNDDENPLWASLNDVTWGILASSLAKDVKTLELMEKKDYNAAKIFLERINWMMYKTHLGNDPVHSKKPKRGSYIKEALAKIIPVYNVTTISNDDDKGNEAMMKLLEHFTSDTKATGTFLAPLTFILNNAKMLLQHASHLKNDREYDKNICKNLTKMAVQNDRVKLNEIANFFFGDKSDAVKENEFSKVFLKASNLICHEVQQWINDADTKNVHPLYDMLLKYYDNHLVQQDYENMF